MNLGIATAGHRESKFFSPACQWQAGIQAPEACVDRLLVTAHSLLPEDPLLLKVYALLLSQEYLKFPWL